MANQGVCPYCTNIVQLTDSRFNSHLNIWRKPCRGAGKMSILTGFRQELSDLGVVQIDAKGVATAVGQRQKIPNAPRGEGEG